MIIHSNFVSDMCSNQALSELLCVFQSMLLELSSIMKKWTESDRSAANPDGVLKRLVEADRKANLIPSLWVYRVLFSECKATTSVPMPNIFSFKNYISCVYLLSVSEEFLQAVDQIWTQIWNSLWPKAQVTAHVMSREAKRSNIYWWL